MITGTRKEYWMSKDIRSLPCVDIYELGKKPSMGGGNLYLSWKNKGHVATICGLYVPLLGAFGDAIDKGTSVKVRITTSKTEFKIERL